MPPRSVVIAAACAASRVGVHPQREVRARVEDHPPGTGDRRRGVVAVRRRHIRVGGAVDDQGGGRDALELERPDLAEPRGVVVHAGAAVRVVGRGGGHREHQRPLALVGERLRRELLELPLGEVALGLQRARDRGPGGVRREESQEPVPGRGVHHQPLVEALRADGELLAHRRRRDQPGDAFGMAHGEPVPAGPAAGPREDADPVGAERVEQGRVEVGLLIDPLPPVEGRAEVAGTRRRDDGEAGVHEEAPHRQGLVGPAGHAVDHEDRRALARTRDLDRTEGRLHHLRDGCGGGLGRHRGGSSAGGAPRVGGRPNGPAIRARARAPRASPAEWPAARTSSRARGQRCGTRRAGRRRPSRAGRGCGR